MCEAVAWCPGAAPGRCPPPRCIWATDWQTRRSRCSRAAAVGWETASCGALPPAFGSLPRPCPPMSLWSPRWRGSGRQSRCGHRSASRRLACCRWPHWWVTSRQRCLGGLQNWGRRWTASHRSQSRRQGGAQVQWTGTAGDYKGKKMLQYTVLPFVRF